jgi:hypothetical protein
MESQPIARAEAQRHIEMFERETGVPGKVPEHPTPMPTASKARVEGETPVDQSDCGIDVLAGSTENEGSDGENVGVVGADSERSSARSMLVCRFVSRSSVQSSRSSCTWQYAAWARADP